MLFSWITKLEIMTPAKIQRHHGYLSGRSMEHPAGAFVLVYLRALTGKLKQTFPWEPS
jgi:hypothetical protein